MVAQKVELIVRLKYETLIAKAAEKTKIPLLTAKDIRLRAREVYAKFQELGLPPPLYKEQVVRKPGSGTKPKIIEQEIIIILNSYTISRKQRKKLWHIVTKEEGFFDLYRRIIEKKLCKRGLRRYKSIKKLGLTDIQKA